MPQRSRPRLRAPRARRSGRHGLFRGNGAVAAVVVLSVVVAGLLAACSSGFDPNSPCTSDGQMAGAYPDLESQVPKAFQGKAPGQLNSGRICSTDGLSTLKGHGIDEVHYAGGVWNTGTDSGVSLATFSAPDATHLEPDWVADFYQTGAANGKNVASVQAGTYPVAPGIVGRKIDVLNSESYQSVIVWERNGRIKIALIADFIREIQTKAAHEAVVRDAVNAWLAADGLPTVSGGASAEPITTPPVAS